MVAIILLKINKKYSIKVNVCWILIIYLILNSLIKKKVSITINLILMPNKKLGELVILLELCYWYMHIYIYIDR